MKITVSPIKNLESVDFPSSHSKKPSQHGLRLLQPHTPLDQKAPRGPRRMANHNRKRTVRTITIWILIAAIFLSFAILSTQSTTTTSESAAERLETRKIVQPTPSYSNQDTNLAMKTLLERKLREEGMRLGECGMFKCSKRWNAYMDAEIIRVFGR